ncbi:MAG: Permease of the drug/metabolite transporter (DMT) superfamily [Verrucomicrobia bacterium]|nr:MAG: Permease of the drug/metabolite transporter (DMT) superfamily [Verrucomicrobiota bacterium]
MPAATLFPLVSAFVYTVAALLFKRSSDLGAGLWRTTFVANLICALLFSMLWLEGGPAPDPARLWQPGLIAACLFLGQLSQFFALERGDVSVAVPVFGLKVVIVAFLTPLFTGQPVSSSLWMGALLSTIGIVLLNRQDVDKRPRGLAVTIIGGTVGAICFAIFDLLVQRWGPEWGPGRLLPAIFWINAFLSLGLIQRFSAPLHELPRGTWPWLLGGCVLLAAQSILFVRTIALHGQATSANILYSSRGLMSVLFVWLAGHWFVNHERHLGARVMRWRLLGASLMLGSIVLVLTSR